MKHRLYYVLFAVMLLTMIVHVFRNPIYDAGYNSTQNFTIISPVPAITPEEFQKQIVLLVNNERTKDELKPLNENQELDDSAKNKADDMFAKDYWAHNSPDGTAPWNQFISAGYTYKHAGENLARNFSSPEGTVLAWMKSPAHKSVILNPKYTETGVWVGEGKVNGIETFLIIQHFAAPL